MQLKTFENEIPATILQRGKEYYNDGAVKDLQEMDNGQWFAIVEGNEDYEVDIRTDKNGEVLDYSCTCPYDGEICKHVVALLYRIRDERQEHKPQKTKPQDDWKKLISVVPEEGLRKFVTDYAMKNKDFRNKLMISFSEYDSGDKQSKYLQIVENIFSAASGRHGYIEYHQTYGVVSQVHDLLSKADGLIESGLYNEAFAIASAVATVCIDAIQSMDDSDGECGDAINEAFSCISKIFQSDVKEPFKNEIFEWVLAQVDNPDYNDYSCDDELMPLLIITCDTPDKEKRILALLDEQQRKVSKEEGWSGEYKVRKLLGLKIDVLENSGKHNEAEKIIAANLHIHDFREMEVKKLLEKKDFEGAVLLIEEGINIAVRNNYPGIATKWEEQLLDIYKLQKNVLKIRNIAKKLYFSGRYEMKYYREFKSTFSNDEWKPELEEIVSTLKKEAGKRSTFFRSVPGNIADVYIEENMWESLFGLIKANPDIQSLLHYSKYLKDGYASELIPLYKHAIEGAAQRASSRNEYADIASYLKEMVKLEGGKGPARLLKMYLLETYKKRPAFRDELNKVSI